MFYGVKYNWSKIRLKAKGPFLKPVVKCRKDFHFKLPVVCIMAFRFQPELFGVAPIINIPDFNSK